uniref:NACHT domain-containing protein n=1 Tax=Amphimedon queenslandica TaxID=400682 RepID=A0A1X7VRX2_AMPQE
MESLLDSRPSSPELMKQVCLESKWYDIGVMLDLNSEKLDAIRYSSVSERTKTSDMYRLWLESNPQATRRELVEVLEDMELKTLAAEYKEYLRHQSIENTALRPRPTQPVPTKILIIVRSPPPESRTPTPGVIEQYGSELREKYTETLTKYKDPNYNKYPTAGPVSMHVPFIPLISIVVKNVTKSTAEWLLSTTPKEIVRNEEIMKIQIEDILKPVSEEQLRFVLIEGEPGIGKSTLAKELVLRWAKGSDALLNNYDIVFLIQLRFETYHKFNASIEDLFVDLDDQSINMKHLKLKIKKAKGAGILWILDGFDELPNHLKSNSVLMKLIKGDNLSKSTVIVTSRPVASDLLLRFLHDHNSKHISLRGFDSTKIEEYALKYFNDKNKAYKFHSYYSGNIVIESMLYNPLNCFIVCTIFNDFIATSNEQYPKTMTSLYNHYVRILLKRHLIDAGLISDLDYDMPQHLMLETDFNDPLLQTVWKNFSRLSKIAYDGVMKQQYIFGKELHNVTKLSMMDTIVNFFVFQKDESSSFLHTTLQEYFAAVYLLNNKPKIKIKNHEYVELQPNLKTVFIFYVGICKMTGRELVSTVMDILKQNISRPTNDDDYVQIGSIMLGCLYEDDSLLYNIGLSSNHSYSSSSSTNFDYYICGYLVAVHKITYKVEFYNSDQVKAFNKGLLSHSTSSGKLAFEFQIKDTDERQKGFKEILLMPSHLVLFVTPNFQWSCNATSENPFLKLTKLNRLGLLAVNLHENDFARLEQLIAPGRPLKLVLMENYGTPYNNILNIIKMHTSLEELTIRDGVDAHKHGTETFISVQSLEPPAYQTIIWTKSTNNLRVDYFEKFFYHIKIRKLPTIRLSSFTSFTYIKTSKTKSVDMWDRWTRNY